LDPKCGNAKRALATPHCQVYPSSDQPEEIDVKQYECLVPGCSWHTEAEEPAEIVRRAAEHMRSVHGEEMVRPEMIERIKARMHERGAQAPRA
jgi:predicted small metal-binding protein